MKDNLQAPYLSFIKSVSFALKQFRLYPQEHPIAQEVVKTLGREVAKFFESNEKITLGAMQHRLVIGGELANEKEMACQDLARELERLAVDGLILRQGLDACEMTAFINLMSMRSKNLEEKGGFQKAFQEAGFGHIHLLKGKFKLVEDGQVVMTEDVLEQGAASQSGPQAVETSQKSEPETPNASSAKPVTSISEVILRLRQEQPGGGPSGEVPLQVDSGKIVEQLEKTPQDIAKLAVENVDDIDQLEKIVRKVIHFLIEHLIAYLVEQGKDITRALEKLAKELQKALQKLGDSPEFEEFRKKIPTLFEEGTDELRVQMICRTHQQYPGDLKRMQKITQKLLKDEQVRRRLTPSLKEELMKEGMDAGVVDSLFVHVEEKIEQKRKKVTVDAEELEELRRKAERFDEGFGQHMKATIKQLEREKRVIADEKERVDAVIRNLAEGLLVVDQHGKVVLMNPAAERLLGVKQSEKMGRPVGDGLKNEHVMSMATGDLKDAEQVSKRVEVISIQDETKRILQASTAVIENENGKTVGMVSVLSDVTREKELSELKSKFVANVSHELRTPLVAIQKSLSLLLDKEAGDINTDQEKFLSIATRNIERLSRLINDILDVSKLEAGKVALKPKPVPVKELVTHVLSTMETWIRDKKLKIETPFSGSITEVEVDPDRLTQVLTNLIGNAIKFTPEGGAITIGIKTDIRDSSLSAEECAEISVRDTGIGIAAADQKRIFEKFEQVSLVQPSGISSTGLGLGIAREIVELHSGKIWVESEEGKGSCFAFRIPVKFKLNEVIQPQI